MAPKTETDLTELAELFAAHSGNHVPIDLSAELVLEIVLNEIVEQACVATGATGAAVMLQREGEMVCRASSGASAPELGARLGGEPGLTAECIKTWQIQHCEDALSDPRADAEASRSLGVRSMMVLPLLRNGGLVGVLEVFSPRRAAFGQQDEHTLQAFAQRILKNLGQASEFARDGARPVQHPHSNRAWPTPGNHSTLLFNNPLANPDEDILTSAERVKDEETARLRRQTRTLDAVTLALAAAVAVCAVLLATLVGLRLTWGNHAGRNLGAVPGQKASSLSRGANAKASSISDASPGFTAEQLTTSKDAKAPTGASPSKGDSIDTTPPGSLLVFEDGKEIFRMMPGHPARTARSAPPAAPRDGARKASLQKNTHDEIRAAAAVEPAGTIESSTEAAQGSVLRRMEPEYPEEARRRGIQGVVVLDVRIGSDGGVEEVKLISGQSLLAEAATTAVKQWRFKPRVVQGQPVGMQTRVTLNFRMPQ